MDRLLESSLNRSLIDVIEGHKNLHENLERKEIIKHVLDNREAIASKNGALATWTAPESTGRRPKDTYIVKRKSSEADIDWTSPNNIGINEEIFDIVFSDALDYLLKRDNIYITDRVIGADSNYALPVKTITSEALTALFTDNMFRPIPKDIKKSVFADKGFQLVTVPFDKLDSIKYKSLLRVTPNGDTSDVAVIMDLDRKLGVIVGSAYLGSVKKLMFTVMNYYLPFEGVLPLHCSANEDKNGRSALLLGLSGTGKTTLSADPERSLLGDDEHGWSDDGIANFENGCYAKMININPEKEPEIYEAVMHEANPLDHGAIIENAMVYPNGVFDFNDSRITENSRTSYPLSFLSNIKETSVSGHPTTILFLTADAYGVLPPVSKLDPDQAKLWFLMGYTSKLAGTETGITEPQATFSRFFGQPFMPLNPDFYSSMLGDKMQKFNTKVYLINTGWYGGVYGVGKRIDLKLTRAMVNAALNGELENVEYQHDELFHLNVPKTCPAVPNKILNPVNMWIEKEEYELTANRLANKFSAAFDEAYGDKQIKESVRNQCPGK
ncbi:MAG: phosphoenolpyruvate carboxykinase (ATP) [Bacteroidales bacterium]|jgi:phosphoenolpyruvate carboxykinase (ATP)|nr:phosphoenolpyruvate carboxykinase (ATP) [Bacteroidales bacterium]